LAIRSLFNLHPAPEFLAWLQRMGIYGDLAPAAQTDDIHRQFVSSIELALKGAADHAL
jgi:ethanolamine ammonia-lyase large subunit